MVSNLRLEKLVVLIAVVALGAALYLFSKLDDAASSSKESAKGAGKITRRVNDVRRKADQEVKWSQVPDAEQVYVRDHIFTGERSQVEIELKNGAQISMNENSLIVIANPNDHDGLELEVGSLLSRLKKNQILRLLRTGTPLTLKGADDTAQVQVTQVEDGDLNITVLSGELQFNSQGEVQTVKQNQAVVFEAKAETPKIVTYSISLLSPSAGEKILTENTEKIQLRWQPEPHTKRYTVVLAQDSSLSAPFQTLETSETQISVGLPEGEIHWQVLALTEDNIPSKSPVSFFRHEINPEVSLEEELVPTEPILEEASAEPVVRRAPVAVEPEPVPLQPQTEAGSKLEVPSEAEIEPPAMLAGSEPSRARKYWLWVGAGVNYQIYEQTVLNFNGSNEFQNIKAPSALLRAGFEQGQWGLDLSYLQSPGEVKPTQDANIKNGQYHWQTFSGEGLYLLNAQHLTHIRFGVQQHSLPFMYLKPSESIIEVRKNSLVLATLGLDHFYVLSQDFRFEWMARYQYPISSSGANGAKFDVEPRYAFDGSVGGVYTVNETARLGIYWYGQLHEYQFTYTGPSSLFGKQLLFYSNLEIRLGYEF